MAQTLDTLVVELFLNSSAFAAQSKGVEKALNGIKAAAQATGLVVAAMFVKSGISQFVAQAQELGNLSRSVRENTEDLQAWGEAVKREGGTAEGFNATVKKLSDDLMSIPLTGGNSPLLGGLTRLGVQFRNLDGSVRKPLAVLKDLSSRFQGMSAAQSLAIGKKLGLDEPTIRLLQKGRKGLDELLVKYKELGVMSNQDVKTGERLKKMFLDYQQVITALGLRFVRLFLPAAEKVSQWLTTAAKWVRQHGRAVEAAIIAIGLAISNTLVPALLKLAFNPVLLGLALMSTALFLLVEDFMAWKKGADSAFSEVWEWFSKIEEKWPDLAIAGRQAAEWVKVAWESLPEVIGDVANAIEIIVSGLTKLFKGAYKAVGWVGAKIAEFQQDDYEYAGVFERARAGKLIPTVPKGLMGGRGFTPITNQNSRTQNINYNAPIYLQTNDRNMADIGRSLPNQTPLMRTVYQSDGQMD
ncbi:MAG: hypothetical protein KHX55_02525 [Proteobacteria bacterium]|nr:hypothetical protein [Pseudomonadota bacterium]